MSVFHENTMVLSLPTQNGDLQSLQPPDVSISENPCPSGTFAWLPAPLQLSGVHALPFLAAVWAPQRGVQSPAVSNSSLHPNQRAASPALVHRLSGPAIVCWRTVPEGYPCLSSWWRQIATCMEMLPQIRGVAAEWQVINRHGACICIYQVAGKMTEWKAAWENKKNGQIKDWDMCNCRKCNMFHQEQMNKTESAVRGKIFFKKTQHIRINKHIEFFSQLLLRKCWRIVLTVAKGAHTFCHAT